MIESRDQAAMEFGLVAGLAGLALWPGVSARTRAVAGGGAAFLAGLGAATDYEGGIRPLIPLKQHRAMELASGAAMLATGLRDRGEKGGWLLAAAGAAQIALAAGGADEARWGVVEMAYRPLAFPKPAADGIWTVDDVLGPGLPVRMTVIRLQNGDLLLHSPTRHSPALQLALEAIGPIRHLVAPNTVHWTFLQGWARALPRARRYAAPGLAERRQVRRAGLRFDETLSDTPPAPWAGEIEQAVVRGGLGFAEVALFHRPTRTAIFADLVQNFEWRKLAWPLRPLAWLLGNLAPTGRAPAHLRAVVGSVPPEVGRRIVGWEPARVLVAHGRGFETGAADRLARSLAWLTRARGRPSGRHW